MKQCLMSDAQDLSQNKMCSTLENEEQISSCEILPLTVNDPRSLPDKRIGDIPGSASTLIHNNELDDEAKKQVAIPGISDNIEKSLSPSWSNFEGRSIFIESLWHASGGVSSPMNENELCMEKHHKRMDFLCLDDPKSGKWKTSNDVQYSRSCPVLLLRNNDKKGSPIG